MRIEGTPIMPIDLPVSRAHTLSAMRSIAAPGLFSLDHNTKEHLRRHTSALLAADRDTARTEFERFRNVKERRLELPEDLLREHLQGKTVVVTGGTGQIGSSLLAEMARFEPGKVVSVSRGITTPVRKHQGVMYARLDVRDEEGMQDLFADIKPDIVYHLAAQHDPGLAEREVQHTLTTNIMGTRNVIDAARTNGTPQIVYASTGKALRPFTSDTYASTKKVSEWLMADEAEHGDILCSGVRFTHVVDNSIVFKRIQQWVESDEPIRLHGDGIHFYMQSSLEAAHLLLSAGLDEQRGKFNLHAIRDLDWPVNLVNLTLGYMADTNKVTPIYFCGYESGYEELPYPGLYDPMLAGEVSPLINAFEAPETTFAECQQVDRFPFEIAHDDDAIAQFKALDYECNGDADSAALHSLKDALSWKMLDARLQRVPLSTLRRVEHRMRSIPAQNLNEEHVRTNNAVSATIQARS